MKTVSLAANLDNSPDPVPARFRWCMRLSYPTLLCVSVSCAILTTSGCGSNKQSTSSPSPLPTIIEQPHSLAAPLGASATFSVTASYTGSLRYQWEQNGVFIPNAVSSSYTDPSVTGTDNNNTFSVIITGANGSVSSIKATLYVGARSPKSGDLRFQQVGAPTTIDGYSGTETTALLGRLGLVFSGQNGAPLGLSLSTCGAAGSPYACTWTVQLFSLPASASTITASYNSDYLSNMSTYLTPLLDDTATVLTSLDIEGGNSAYAASSVTTVGQPAFRSHQSSIPLAELPQAATQEGSEGRVITAIASNAGIVQYTAYSWDGDTSVYDTAISQGTYSQIASECGALAQEGVHHYRCRRNCYGWLHNCGGKGVW